MSYPKIGEIWQVKRDAVRMERDMTVVVIDIAPLDSMVWYSYPHYQTVYKKPLAVFMRETFKVTNVS